MELAMIGLGKMGLNMATRLVRGGHRVTGYALSPESVEAAKKNGAEGASSLEEVVKKLGAPRILWIMVPSGPPTDDTITKLSGLLSKGDIIIDGGNSNYKDSIRHAELLESKGIEFVDSGTSGGIWGLADGYSLMIGGKQEVVEKLSPIFETLAPAKDQGWGYVGPHGAGHFVKMVHNGIEYGMMQALAEGFNIMRAKTGIWAGPGEYFGDLAVRERSAFLAAGPDRARLESGPDPVRHRALGGGFGRRPLDRGGGNRSRCAGAHHHAGITDALRQPGPRELCGALAGGDAKPIWRPCGQESGIDPYTRG